MDLELASNLRINEEAFELCSSLKKVIINEDSLIQDHVFAGCDCLEEVTINKNCTLSVVFFNPDMGRLYCKKLKKVYIGENVKIGAYCFNNSINLSEITVEKGAVIEEGAFGKTNLKFVSIPRGCKVSRKAFPEDCKVKKPFFGIF